LTCRRADAPTEPGQGKAATVACDRVDAPPQNLVRDQRGVAAIEFAFIAGFLCLAVLNVSDIAIYLYKRMQVENAAQMGIINALSTCGVNQLPATIGTNCPALSAAVTAAVQSTSLGSAVTSTVTEGWYCINSSSALVLVVPVTSAKPTSCSSVGMAALKPSDYIKVAVSFAYAPLFSGASVGGLFTTPITKSALVRMQ
jgi:Flp pilus assembly protein TadG